MRYRMILLFTCVLCLVLATNADAASINTPSCQPTPTSSAGSLITAKIVDISAAQSSMQIRCRQDKNLTTTTIAVTNPALKATLQHFGEGDLVVLQHNQEAGLQSLTVVTRELSWGTRIVTLILTIIGLFGIFLGLLGFKFWNLKNLIVGGDNRYSNSKTQIVLWFSILIITYITCIVLRSYYGGIDFVGGVTIPQNLLLLSGLSALTFATAKGITESRINSDRETRELKNPNNNRPKFPDDLFRDDKGSVDLGDFQMIIITLLAVVVYLAEVLGFLGMIEFHKVVTLPDVDTTILATFGLGQGAYLAKKFVGDAGGGKPVPDSNS